jgi:hypothetical protein
MNNSKRTENYIKQRKGNSEECLTFRQKRRIRKNANKEST